MVQMATHGEGEPTENAARMLEQLEDWTSDTTQHSLRNLHYAIFCVGNKTYEHYCATGRRVDEHLLTLGATRVGPRGEGDANKTLAEDLTSWQEFLLEAMRTSLGFKDTSAQRISDLQVTEHAPESIDKNQLHMGLVHETLPGATPSHSAKVVSTGELFASGERSCMFAEFDLQNSGLTYQAGDHLGVWPTNPEEEVERCLRPLGLDPRSVISITSLDAGVKIPFPTPTTLITLFRHYLGLTAQVNRRLCESLAKFAEPSSQTAENLKRWGSNKAAFLAEIEPRCLTFCQLLLHANGSDYTDRSTLVSPWAVPLEWIISNVPRLQPRFYSISSSPKVNPRTVQITSVVLRYPPEITQSDAVHHVHGTMSNYLLSRYLKTQAEGSAHSPRYRDTPSYHFPDEAQVPIFIRPSTFRLPVDPKTPIIMIGPGTGVAPFRSFLHDRAAAARAVMSSSQSISTWGDMVLFYGCRSAETDFLYREEWDALAGDLDDKFRIVTAFSRSSSPRQYVTDLLRLQSDLVRKLVNHRGGIIYICGAAKMAADVKEVLDVILADEKAARRPIDVLQSEKRLRLDVW